MFSRKEKSPSKNFRMNTGFSLIEVLLVVGMGAIIFAMSAPFSMRLYKTQILDEAQSNIVEALQRARHNASLQKYDSQWGVYLDDADDHFVLFAGDSYAEKVDAYDEDYPLNAGITVTGDWTEVVFSKLTGLPSTTGTTTLTYGNLTRGILVESSGVVSKVANGGG